MDIGTIIGIIVAYVMVVVAILLGAGLTVYIEPAAVVLVLFGTLGIIFIHFPVARILALSRTLMMTVTYKMDTPDNLIEQLVSFAVRARRDGILALESAGDDVEDEFLGKGIRLAVDGTEPEVIKAILETDMEYIEERHRLNISLLEAIQDFAPAMGMIGTLIGLVAMLQSLDDPTSIGPAMATALLTTFYGSLMANLFGGPLAGRLRIRNSEEMLLRQVMIAGIMAIQSGDNPRIVEHKLNAFLPPVMRRSQFE